MNRVQTSDVITATCLVQEVVERYPQTIAAFTRLGFNCVGCYIAPHHTVADCAREHEMDVEPVLVELQQAIAAE